MNLFLRFLYHNLHIARLIVGQRLQCLN
uniref:Uncharacterized protein n=1 Tax=Arundo donax TaxID=35708 RepID=A0A0A9C913_ARUDO